MAKMRAMQVAKAGGPLELVEKEIPAPGPGQVLVKVHACGICHSDSLTVEGTLARHQLSSRAGTRGGGRRERDRVRRARLEGRRSRRHRMVWRQLRLL